MTDRPARRCADEGREAELKLVGRAGRRPKKPVKATPPPLEPGMSAARSFQVIGFSCLQHLLANEPVLRETRDPEAVHQMRVAVRRLRAAISIFKAMAADERGDAVRRDLRWLATRLGEARDLDVFIEKTIAPARQRRPHAEDLAALAAAYEERRKAAYEKAREAVSSGRLDRIALATAAWLEKGRWLSREDTAARSEQRVEDLAAKELGRRWKRVRRRAKHLEALEPPARHEVRIAVKKLRYAAEFFRALFPGKARAKRAKALRAALGELQDRLGDLNDIAVADKMEHAREHEAAARLLAREQACRLGEHLEAAKAAYRKFAATDPFWR
jgi:triphosphatase